MRQLIICGLVIFSLSSCSDFGPEIAENNSEELIRIFEVALADGYGSIHVRSEDEVARRLEKHGIDRMTIQFKETFYSDLADSLVIFEKESPNIFTPEKRIIYDFSKKNRNFGNEENANANYTRIQIKERWYYETIGFD